MYIYRYIYIYIYIYTYNVFYNKNNVYITAVLSLMRLSRISTQAINKHLDCS